MKDQGPDPAIASGTPQPGSPILDELYRTLGSVQAGIETRQQEARTARTQALQAEQQLLAQRQQAEDDQDPDAFDRATAGLDELRRVFDLIDHDLGAAGDAQEQQDDDGDSAARGDRGDSPERGDGSPVAPGSPGGQLRPDSPGDADDGDADRSVG